MLEGGIRVPFIVWSKDIENSKQSGKIYDGLVSLADIAPTLMAQACDKPYAHPTDGVNIMPYITGNKPPLKGRTWFCSLGGSLEKLTGIKKFTRRQYDAEIVHLAYIQDDQKVLCWIPQDGTSPGAVYAELPNVIGKKNQSDLLAEPTPVSGVVPGKGAGRNLYKQMTELIHSSGDTMVPVWSGDRGKSSKSWMSFAEKTKK
jgi:hypothetical protein